MEERSRLTNFGQIGYTSLQFNTALWRLFPSRTYNSDIRVIKKARNLQYGDATHCMLKLVELGNYHSSNGDVFDMASDRGSRLDTLYWSGSFSSLFIEKYIDFILIDGIHKTRIYDLSLVVTTVVDSLDVSIPVSFYLILQKIHHQLRLILIF